MYGEWNCCPSCYFLSSTSFLYLCLICLFIDSIIDVHTYIMMSWVWINIFFYLMVRADAAVIVHLWEVLILDELENR